MLNVGDTVTIEDLNSANGTQVRSHTINLGQAVPVVVGESVVMGTITLIVQHRSRQMRTRRLWRHDYFETRLEEECAREARSGAPFAVLRIHADPKASDSFVEETLSEIVREADSTGRTSTRC